MQGAEAFYAWAMSQNPYAAGYPADPNQIPPRTSVLAIISLVTALLCCIPGFGVLGALLGVVATFRISGSGGRKTGMGLAIAGIIVGIVVSIIWCFVVIGGVAAMKQASQFMTAPVTVMTYSDASKVRATLSTTLSPQVTDAEWARFQSEISAELGVIQPVPTSPWEFFKQYGKVGDLMNGRKQNNAVPLPLIGDKGSGVLLIHLPQGNSNVQPSGNPGELFLSMAENFSVLLPSGTEVWLIDPSKVILPSRNPIPPALPAPATP
jgi:hypothetical protein